MLFGISERKRNGTKMNIREPSAGLLEEIAMRTGCMYISDLHMTDILAIKQVFSSVDPAAYSLQEWEDAVLYITGHKKSFKTQAKAKNYLLKFD